jgi:hypothetical protein
VSKLHAASQSQATHRLKLPTSRDRK